MDKEYPSTLARARGGDNMNDITGPEYLEIVISEDGKTVWINNDVTCLFRACRIGELKVDDRRKRR